MKLIFLSFVTWLVMSTASADSFPNNYAVVWKLNTTEPAQQLMKEKLAEQADALLKLWKDSIVENVYMDTDNEKAKKASEDSSFVFFIKAEDTESAANILNEMPFVKHDIARYDLFPVGILWLKQYEEPKKMDKK